VRNIKDEQAKDPEPGAHFRNEPDRKRETTIMKTNFVLIMCDQQLREHLGCYGSRYGVTPNLDRLAGEGVVFENAYTACPVCTPARGALFTGRTPHMCGAYTNGMPLYETVPTMGEIFARHGYRTGYISKWHLDGDGSYMGSGKAARGFPDAVWYDGRRYLDELTPEEQKLGYGSCDNATLRDRDLPDSLCWATRNSNRAIASSAATPAGNSPSCSSSATTNPTRRRTARRVSWMLSVKRMSLFRTPSAMPSRANPRPTANGRRPM
jgi:arylsulfatase A-like enzyme